MIADPKQADDALLDGWLADIDNYGLVDTFAAYAAQTPLARAKMEQWVASPEEWTGRAGWLVLARLVADETTLTDTELTLYLDMLASEIHTRPNYTRDAMNSALIAIGVRNPALEAPALETAAQIGKVVVDHGQTNCKTPDAADYIKKTVAYKQKKQAAPA
jgi:3-methyladenine DNA glycosylase AlkD